jgi:peptidoglycan hydrolase-like protein with peptidoglycan-binding domain
MLTLTGSVGKNGANRPDDIKVIQTLLNRHAPAAGFDRISEDARFGANTLKAIVAFQKAIGLRTPDGVVDPGGRTLKALAARPIEKKAEVPATPAAARGGAGKVVGNVTGVQADLVAYARAVAEFYGRDIKISSGKRNNAEQAAVMFKYWTTNLKRGEIYRFLRDNPATRETLDELYAKAAEGEALSSAEAAESKQKFLTICSALAPKLSAHLAGRAIDVSPKGCMTTAMRDAMKLVVKEVDEDSCYHYETAGAVPAPGDAIRQRWAKA